MFGAFHCQVRGGKKPKKKKPMPPGIVLGVRVMRKEVSKDRVRGDDEPGARGWPVDEQAASLLDCVIFVAWEGVYQNKK